MIVKIVNLQSGARVVMLFPEQNTSDCLYHGVISEQFHPVTVAHNDRWVWAWLMTSGCGLTFGERF